jgi:hypothetical protein
MSDDETCVICGEPAVVMLGIDPMCGPCQDVYGCQICGRDHDTAEHRDWEYDRKVADMERRLGV